jgi:hypothetical protein
MVRVVELVGIARMVAGRVSINLVTMIMIAVSSNDGSL